MTRADWQHIAEERLLAAQALLAANNWPSAYYLVGYAVECGLKSCVLVRIQSEPELIFQEKRFSEKCWTHNLRELLDLANLRLTLRTDCNANRTLAQNWQFVKDWEEKSRYEIRSQLDAVTLCNAITDGTNGVMQWIRARW